MAGIKIVDLPALGRDLAATDLLELSLAGGTGSRKITGQEIINSSKLNVGTTPIINGTSGRLLFQGTGNVLQQSSSLFWDNTNGTLEATTTADNLFGLRLKSITGQLKVKPYLNSTYGVLMESRNAADSAYLPMSYSSSKHLFLDGNVIINSTSDAGFKLDVNGTARVQSGLANNSSATAFQVTGASGSLFRIRGIGDVYLEGSTPTIFYGSSGTFVGGGNANFYSGQGAGNAFFSVVHNNSNVAIRALSNSNVLLNPTAGNVLIGTTTDDGFRLDVNGTARISGQVNLGTNISVATLSNFGLNYINFNALTANQGISAGFSPNGTPGGYAYSFQFSKSSTANNNSLLFIGGGASAGPAANKHLITTSTDGTAIAQPLAFAVATGSWASATPLMTLTTTQNVLINTTTDSGFRLDVNGTARFTGRIDAGTFTAGAGASAYTIATTGRISASGGISFRSPLVGDSIFIGFAPIGTSTVEVYTSSTRIFQFGGAGGDPAGMAVATPNFNPSSGTGNKSIFEVNGVYNTTGTFTGTIRGFYYNPTLTSMTGVTAHYAFHSTSGRVRFEGLPTSPTGLNAGDIYNDGGTLKIV